MSNTKAYKYRAECELDAKAAVAALNTPMIIVERCKIGADVVVQFESDRSLEFIKGVFSTITDGHVMLETVALKKDYTGERKAV